MLGGMYKHTEDSNNTLCGDITLVGVSCALCARIVELGPKELACQSSFPSTAKLDYLLSPMDPLSAPSVALLQVLHPVALVPRSDHPKISVAGIYQKHNETVRWLHRIRNILQRFSPIFQLLLKPSWMYRSARNTGKIRITLSIN